LHSKDTPGASFALVGNVLRRTLTDNARQILQKPKQALCVPTDILREAQRRGAEHVVIVDEHGKRYAAPLARFWQPPSFEVNRGWGVQRALPLSAMVETNKPEQPALFEVNP